ncbi:hypothetical protein AAMO2058_001314200 [Amorphochlora amoebiformis]
MAGARGILGSSRDALVAPRDFRFRGFRILAFSTVLFLLWRGKRREPHVGKLIDSLTMDGEDDPKIAEKFRGRRIISDFDGIGEYDDTANNLLTYQDSHVTNVPYTDFLVTRREGVKKFNRLYSAQFNKAKRVSGKLGSNFISQEESDGDGREGSASKLRGSKRVKREEEIPVVVDDKADSTSQEDKKELIFDLGSMRRLVVSEYNGRRLVSLRQYFIGQGGQILPTRKGISLADDQTTELCTNSAKLSEALKAHNVVYEASLSHSKTAKVKEYKGRFYVDIREYSVGNYGDKYPTHKGLMLTDKEWAKFISCLKTGRFEEMMNEIDPWKTFAVQIDPPFDTDPDSGGTGSIGAQEKI